MPQKIGEKILLVEDDRSLSRLYEAKLLKEGYTVEIAADGEKCLEKVGGYQPDLILLDIIIPKIDGFEVLKRIKANKQLQNIPIILLTNLGQDEDIQKGEQLGADVYLIKANLTPSEMIGKVKEVLGKKS